MSKNNAFKGKVYYYSNINGKEKKIEKEFEDADKFNKFVQENEQISMPSLDWEMPKMGFNNWLGFSSYFDDLLQNKLEEFFGLPETVSSGLPEVDVDLHKYEQEAARIREKELRQKEQEAERQQKIHNLEAALEKLKNYKQMFKDDGNKEKVKEVEADIKKVKDELQDMTK